MDRYLLDRWTDTTCFECCCFSRACLVLPMLGIGVLTTVIGGVAVVIEQPALDLEQVVFALLSVGGALGFVGYLRAHRAARAPSRHNVTATLICLAVGVGDGARRRRLFVAARPSKAGLRRGAPMSWLGLAALFVAANAGVGVVGHRLDAAPDAPPHGTEHVAASSGPRVRQLARRAAVRCDRARDRRPCSRRLTYESRHRSRSPP